MFFSRKQSGRIDFVLVEVREGSGTESNIATLCSCAEKHGAEFDLFGSLVTLTWGTPGDELPPGNRPGLLVKEVSHLLGDEARILHGVEHGHSGITGGVNARRFSIMLPNFSETRQAVQLLEWGEVREWRPTGNK